jgi:hypothetical protein
MVPELLEAIHQSEQSEPSVRAAALLRIARVLTKFDQAEAERLLDRGLALLAALPDDTRTAIAPQATCLAACVAPDRAFALYATTSEDCVDNGKFLVDMARHGHVSAAVAYLTQWSGERRFPYSTAHSVMGYAKDEDRRREILRSALRAWPHQGDLGWHSLHSVVQLFRSHWRLLPPDEASDELIRLVRVIREHADGRLSASFGGSRGKVTFSSQRASLLFELLGPLRRLEPELADAVTETLPELARAAALYPYGYDTDRDRHFEPPSAEALEQWKREWTGFALDTQFFRIDQEKASGFTDSFAYALRTFARDTNERRPNAAPRECWPSAEVFRTILYAAGKYECASAPLLERIPDPDLRLFAQIEFAAGAAGLEQIGGITRENLAGPSRVVSLLKHLSGR